MRSATRDRDRRLHARAAHQRPRRRSAGRASASAAASAVEPRVEQVEARPQPQHQRGVDHVLAGRAEMHVLAMRLRRPPARIWRTSSGTTTPSRAVAGAQRRRCPARSSRARRRWLRAASAGMTPFSASASASALSKREHRRDLGLDAEQRRDLLVAEQAGQEGMIEGETHHQMSKNTVSSVALQVDVEGVGVALARRDQRRARALCARCAASTGSSALAASSSPKYMRVWRPILMPRATIQTRDVRRHQPAVGERHAAGLDRLEDAFAGRHVGRQPAPAGEVRIGGAAHLRRASCRGRPHRPARSRPARPSAARRCRRRRGP